MAKVWELQHQAIHFGINAVCRYSVYFLHPSLSYNASLNPLIILSLGCITLF